MPLLTPYRQQPVNMLSPPEEVALSFPDKSCPLKSLTLTTIRLLKKPSPTVSGPKRWSTPNQFPLLQQHSFRVPTAKTRKTTTTTRTSSGKNGITTTSPRITSTPTNPNSARSKNKTVSRKLDSPRNVNDSGSPPVVLLGLRIRG